MRSRDWEDQGERDVEGPSTVGGYVLKAALLAASLATIVGPAIFLLRMCSVH